MNPRRDVPFGRPWITDEDRRAVLRVLEGPILTHGPEGVAFEKEFADFLGEGAHCVSVSSCMAALHLAWIHFGVGPGDEVIVPAQTHVATAHAVAWTGARPVFVDCDPATGNLTADRIERAITDRTRGISVVHFLGIPCEMPPIVELAGRTGLKVVEDCALAVGSRHGGRHAGLFGDAGCFSFYPVKHLTTGEGGMFVTRHPDVAQSVARTRAFGVDRGHGERKVPGVYDVPSLGLNYRMSEMQAALGRSQLSRVGVILERRRENFTRLAGALAGTGARILDAAGDRGESSHYCLSLVLPDELRERRASLVARIQESGIGTSVYYPHPIPRLRYYRERFGFEAEGFSESVRISDQSIALPVGPHLDPADVEHVGRTVRTILGEARP